jgi:hypothetical protein
MNDSDEKLKKLFGDMRDSDAAHAPSFESCISASSPQTVLFSPAWRIAASFALIVFLGAGVLKLQTCSSGKSYELQTEKWTSISSWQASTDNLLTMSASHTDESYATDTDIWLENSETNGKGSL